MKPWKDRSFFLCSTYSFIISINPNTNHPLLLLLLRLLLLPLFLPLPTGDQSAGLLAAQRIFSAIDAGKVSPIDGLSEAGLMPSTRPKGRIELKNVNFSYPTRPEVEVCKVRRRLLSVAR